MIDQEDFDISFVDDEGDDVFQLEEHTFVDQEDLEEVEISFVSDEEEDDENLDETNEEILWPGALVQEDDTERFVENKVNFRQSFQLLRIFSSKFRQKKWFAEAFIELFPFHEIF